MQWKTKFFPSGVFLTFMVLYMCDGSPQGELIGKWANRLGKDLWDLGQVITKSSEIQSRYAFLNAQVEAKDPKQLLSEIVDNIARMMDRKMDAVRCILKVAEAESKAYDLKNDNTSYRYYSSKYSQIEGEAPVPLPPPVAAHREVYVNMTLNNDTHFYNLFIDTMHSSVHVPANVYDRHDEPQSAIRWSEKLDDMFKKNYEVDPSLSWQYFGSSSGIMRHYPAMRWTDNGDNAAFDCRIRTWFIEAATCTKDVVILIDNSGSMSGFRKHVAAYTARTILETFSNNDYVTIMNFSETVDYLVPCFNNTLVQATKENIEVFNTYLDTLDSANKSIAGIALKEAFQLLKLYREKRGCVTENDTHCNQAIMLITDGAVPANLTDIWKKYNRLFNDTKIPVRIFTYLVEDDFANEPQLENMACNNRGKHMRVANLEQVTSSVYEYIKVFARPLVLKGDEHPVSWTHAYFDITFDAKNKGPLTDAYRLLLSVAVPAYDLRGNDDNTTVKAELLGVAGTDVTLDDIKKLTFPYKIGVNAHAFIVSNNGYVVMHPALRPMFEGRLKRNFNSVDITEVEQIDDDSGPREIGDTLYKLRHDIVNEFSGAIHDVNLKFYYDNMKRISRSKFDYYFSRIENTPFSVGIALPDLYGNFTIEVGDEIERNRHTGINITSFFEGSNWKIHPEWVYCKYHYLEGHEFDTPEEELMHFLSKMYDPIQEFKWSRQFEKLPKHVSFDEDLDSVDCNRNQTLGDDDYYCDSELVQKLVFDAKNTMEAFAEEWTFQNKIEQLLFERFNATLRFVATMSGLTRWEYISEEVENNTLQEFGDLHYRAIDETWYKSAVFQHEYDEESFVYSVPFDANLSDTDNILVTGSYAIFPKDALMQAPGSVVGFQFSHSHFKKRFFDIAGDKYNCHDCLPCGPELDCYVVDSSGYIIISERESEIGNFFGEVQGDVMDSMLKERIFEKVTVHDYQGLCPYQKLTSGILPEYHIPDSNWKLTNLFDELTTTTPKPTTTRRLRKGEVEEEEKYFRELRVPKFETKYRTCEKERDLFVLRQSIFINGSGYSGEVPQTCSRPFYVKRIPNSNLLLVSIKTDFPSCFKKYTTDLKEIFYENVTELPCHKLYLNDLPRRLLQGCYNEHPKEHLLAKCGSALNYRIGAFALIVNSFYIKFFSLHYLMYSFS